MKPDRFPNAILDTAPILAAGEEFRIHPFDLVELRLGFRFCWPDNALSGIFRGVRLIADEAAPRLPRLPL